MKNINKNNEKIKSGFKIPENYFEQFESKILQKVVIKNESKIISLWQNKRIWMTSIAAMFLVSFAFLVHFLMNTNTSLENEAVESFLAMQPIVNNYEIASQLTNEDFISLEESLLLNDDAVALYLEENNQNIDLYLD